MYIYDFEDKRAFYAEQGLKESFGQQLLASDFIRMKTSLYYVVMVEVKRDVTVCRVQRISLVVVGL